MVQILRTTVHGTVAQGQTHNANLYNLSNYTKKCKIKVSNVNGMNIIWWLKLCNKKNLWFTTSKNTFPTNPQPYFYKLRLVTIYIIIKILITVKFTFITLIIVYYF